MTSFFDNSRNNHPISLQTFLSCQWQPQNYWPLKKAHILAWNLNVKLLNVGLIQGILKGEVSMYRWPPVWLVWNQLYGNWQFLFYLQNRLSQNNQTGGQQYSDTSPFSIPCLIWQRIKKLGNVLSLFHQWFYCIPGKAHSNWSGSNVITLFTSVFYECS